MKEYMLFIRTKGDHLEGLAPEVLNEHLQKVGKYIEGLIKEGRLKSAQPLEMTDGVMLSGKRGAFKDGPFNETKEVIAGYFHVLANDLEEAVAIAKNNPVFDLTEGRIEVRAVKHLEGIN